MALIIETDTYISAVDAATYIAKNYISSDEKLLAWDALSASDIDVLLRKAAQVIDRQPLKGTKAVYTQLMAFPRRLRSYDPSLQLFIPEVVTPDAVKYAQVEIALDLMTGPSKRTELQRQGVKSFSVGSLSENYGSGKANPLPYEAKELLKPYLAGGVQIV